MHKQHFYYSICFKNNVILKDSTELKIVSTVGKRSLPPWWSTYLWIVIINLELSLDCVNGFVVQSLSRLTLCNPMGCSTPRSPVLHYLLEFVQIHVHWAGDPMQPPCPLFSPSPSAFNLPQHQGLFQWIGSSPQVVLHIRSLA